MLTFLGAGRALFDSFVALSRTGLKLAVVFLSLCVVAPGIGHHAHAAGANNAISGITIITHGYQALGTYLPDWANEMALSIRTRIGTDNNGNKVRIYRVLYDQMAGGTQSDDRVYLCTTLAGACPEDTGGIDTTLSGGAIILLDWAAASDEQASLPTYSAQDVADRFFDYLFGRQHHGHYVQELPIHLIGHSRGASLNSRLAYRLAELGIVVEQVTTIDPHPVDALWPVDWVPETFVNVIFADNYYRTGAAPTGQPVPGAKDFDLSNTITGDPYKPIDCSEHAQIHAYYHGTINLLATTDGTCDILASWYQQSTARNRTGYNYSRFTDSTVPRPWGGINKYLANAFGFGDRALVDTALQLWPNVGFDQRETYPWQVTVGSTVDIPYYFVDRNSQQSIDFFTDTDTNPYNGIGTYLGTWFHNSTPAPNIQADTFSWTPIAADVGTRFIGARTTNSRTNPTRVRYDYYLKPIVVSAAPVMAPHIDMVSPPLFTASSTAQPISIAGTNFTNSSRLVFYYPDNTPSPPRTPTSYTTTSLTYSAQFLVGGAWKVQVVNSPGVESNIVPITVTSVANAPAVPTGVSASDAVYTLMVYVSWNGVSGATNYELWRAQSATGTKTKLTTSNWTSTAWGDTQVVANRPYYYWVKACNASGLCSDFSAPDTGFIGTVATGTVSAATSPSPASGDTSVSISVGKLMWANGGGALSYDVYFATHSTLVAGDLKGSPQGTEITIPTLTNSTTYYWRVDAKANGVTVPGTVWSFTTRAASAGNTPNQAINPTPAHLAQNLPLSNVVLSWSDGGGAQSYDVYFGQNFQPGAAQFLGNTTSTSWPLPTLQYGNFYYWKIVARNAAGAAGFAGASTWQFQTEPPAPPQAVGADPANGATSVPAASFNLHWYDPSASSSTIFDVYFGTNPSPGAGEFQVTTIQGAWQTPVLQLNTKYYWRINSHNHAGMTVGQVWNFTTWVAPPGFLKVSLGGLSSAGQVGGPFRSPSKSYTLTNIGPQALNFAVSNTHSWLTLSSTVGTLQPGEAKVVTASLGPDAIALPAGYYSDSIDFVNTTTSWNIDSRAVSLAVGVPLASWDIAQIAGGKLTILAVKSDGSLYGWGSLSSRGLAAPAQATSSAPIRIGARTDWASVSVGETHVLALTKDGHLYSWGTNGSGELGFGDLVTRNTPTQVGTDSNWVQVAAGLVHSIALKSDGRLFAFGNNGWGQLGVGDYTNRLVPTQVGTATDWASIATSGYAVTAIKRDGRMFTWGSGASTTGKDVPAPVQVGAFSDWQTAAGGYSQFYAIRTNGCLYSWGAGNNGQLGLGDTNPRYTATQIGIDCDWIKVTAGGGAHGMALKRDGRLFGWGSNGTGALGVGDWTDRLSPVLILQNANIQSIAASNIASFMTLNDGSLFSWGDNLGELGLGFLLNGLYRGIPTPSKVDVDWALSANVTLNIDGSTGTKKYDPLTSGLLITRYLAGLTGTALTTGALGNTAARTDPSEIKTYLDDNRSLLDVNGDGIVDLTTDGLIILRYMFGMRGEALVAGLVDPMGTGRTTAEIEIYLQSLMP